MVRLVNWESKRPIPIPNTTFPSIVSTIWVYRLNDPPHMNVPNAETINPTITMYLDPNLDYKRALISEKIKMEMEADKRAFFLNIYSFSYLILVHINQLNSKYLNR